MGYLAVPFEANKTVFSVPGNSTSSQILEDEQAGMELSDALVRFSIDLDADIKRTYEMMHTCMTELSIL